MSALRPSPECVENAMVDPTKGFLGAVVTVVIRPSSNLWIELTNQILRFYCFVTLDGIPDIIQEFLDITFSRLDDELAIILPDIKAEKIKPFVDVRDRCFLL